MTVATITQAQTIVTGAGVLNKIYIPFNVAEGRFPQVHSTILINIADTADHTRIIPPLWGMDHDMAMMIGTRWPYYWLQHNADPIISECILSTTPMPFTKGLSVTSLPQGAVLALDFDVYAPSPSDRKLTQPPKDNRLHPVYAAMRRIAEREARISCRLPVPPEPSYWRVNAALHRMALRASKQAAKHTTLHFIPRSLPPPVDIEGPLPSVVDEKIIPSHVRVIDYLRLSHLMVIDRETQYPKVANFDWLTVVSNDNIEPISETEIELPSVQILPPRAPTGPAETILHATTTRNMNYAR